MLWTVDRIIDIAKGDMQGTKNQSIQPLAWPGNKNAHAIRVAVLDNGVNADLSNYTVNAEFERSDGLRVVADNTEISGSMAIAVIPQGAYIVPGIVRATVELISGNDTVIPIAMLTFRVYGGASGNYADTGEMTYNVNTLLSEIAEARATLQTGYMYSIAPEYSSENEYKPFDYVWKEGLLYRCLDAISAGSEWNEKHWWKVVLSEDFAILLSGLMQTRIETSYPFEDYSITLTGYQKGDVVDTTLNTSSSYKHVILHCNRGDVFVISVSGGDAPRAWAFLDTSYQLVACAKSSTTLVNAYFIAPCDGWFICQTLNANTSSCTRCVFEDNSLQPNNANMLQSQSTPDESVQEETESEVEPE